MKKTIQFYYETLKETFIAWNTSSASRDSTSLAYYTIFAIPGLLIILIWLAGIFFGEEAIKGEISREIGATMGIGVAESIEEMIKGSLVDKDSVFMKTIGVGSLVFGATTIFFQLQKSLNQLWGIEAVPKKVLIKFLLDRANSLGIILTIGFLMMVTMVLSSLVSYFGNIISIYFGMETYIIAQVLNFVVGFFVIVILFALIFKILPDAEITWRSVGSGAIFTAILFTIGKFLLSFYFATSNPTSIFGRAGTVILIMMWVNYTCMLIFFGAMFTKIYAEKKGYKIKPSSYAKWTSENDCGVGNES